MREEPEEVPSIWEGHEFHRASGKRISEPKTVRVRVAVAVDINGDYIASGSSRVSDKKSLKWVTTKPSDKTYWIEADVPLPTTETVEGKVV